MQDFRKRHLVYVIVFLVNFTLLYSLLYFVIVPDYYVYTALTMKETVYGGDDADIVFLGSSKTYSTISPDIVERELGLSAIDLCSSGQGMMGGYYMLKEYFNYHQAKYVVLEVQEGKLLGFNLDTKGRSAANYQITDSIKKTSPVFWEYFFNAYNIDNWFSAFIPLSHYRSNFTGGFALKRLKTGEALNVALKKPYGEYRGQGYINDDSYNGESIDCGTAEYLDDVLTPNVEVCTESVTYFEKTVALCQENDAQIILMTYPVTDHATSLSRMRGCYEFYTDLSKKNDVPYFDMMLCREYTMVKNDAYDFSDEGHMNDTGARKYSKYVCKELIKLFENKDYSRDFYNDINEWVTDRESFINSMKHHTS